MDFRPRKPKAHKLFCHYKSVLSAMCIYTAAAPQALMGLSRDSFTLLALIVYLLYLNWKLTMVVVVLAPGMTWVMRKLSRRLYGLTRVA